MSAAETPTRALCDTWSSDSTPPWTDRRWSRTWHCRTGSPL